jgi:hypothetical protein
MRGYSDIIQPWITPNIATNAGKQRTQRTSIATRISETDCLPFVSPAGARQPAFGQPRILIGVGSMSRQTGSGSATSPVSGDSATATAHSPQRPGIARNTERNLRLSRLLATAKIQRPTGRPGESTPERTNKRRWNVTSGATDLRTSPMSARIAAWPYGVAPSAATQQPKRSLPCFAMIPARIAALLHPATSTTSSQRVRAVVVSGETSPPRVSPVIRSRKTDPSCDSCLKGNN